MLWPPVCLSGSLFEDPTLQSEPGSTHPTTAESQICPPGPDPVVVVFCAQLEAENSLPTTVVPCQSVLGDPGVLFGIGVRKDTEYLALLP